MMTSSSSASILDAGYVGSTTGGPHQFHNHNHNQVEVPSEVEAKKGDPKLVEKVEERDRNDRIVSKIVEEAKIEEKSLRKSSLREEVKDGLMLAMMLLGASPIGLIPILWNTAIWKLFDDPFAQQFDVSLRDQEPVILDDSYVNDPRYWVASLICTDWVVHGYLPIAISLFYRLKERELGILWGFNVAGYIVFVISRSTPMPDIIFKFLAFMPMYGMLIALYFFIMPRNIVMMLGILEQCWIPLFGVFFLFIWHKIPVVGDSNQVLFLCCVFPLSKEFWLLLARRSAWKLGTASTSKMKPSNENLWLFFMYVQISASIYSRLVVSRIESNLTFAVVIFFQGITEILLRVTLPQRDRLLMSLLPSLRASRRIEPTPFPSSMGGNESSLITTSPGGKVELERGLSRKQFYSMVLVGECLAEYVGIIITPLLLWSYHTKPLAFPFDYYTLFFHSNLGEKKPFENEIAVWPLWPWVLSQISCEVCVDVICFVLERRQGFDVLSVWKRHWKRATFLLCLISWNGFILVMLLYRFRDDLSQCRDMDLCFCMCHHGIHKGTLREQYCFQLYPESLGIPNITECPSVP